MSRRPRCFYCGRGISARYRIANGLRLFLALYGVPTNICRTHEDRALARARERAS